ELGSQLHRNELSPRAGDARASQPHQAHAKAQPNRSPDASKRTITPAPRWNNSARFTCAPKLENGWARYARTLEEAWLGDRLHVRICVVQPLDPSELVRALCE